MKQKITLAVRILLGLVFLGAGVSFFLSTPPPLEGRMGTFFEGLVATGYFFQLLKVTEIVCGLALVIGRFVPLALVVLAPILVNILLVHAFLAPEGLPIAIVLAAFEVYLAFFSAEYSPPIKKLFRA